MLGALWRANIQVMLSLEILLIYQIYYRNSGTSFLPENISSHLPSLRFNSIYLQIL